MANLKKFLTFFVQFEGDSSGTRIVVEFLTDPVFFSPPTGYATVFQIASSLPASVSHVSVGGATLSSASYNSLTGALTVDLTAAPSNGTICSISGYAEYN